VQQTVLKTDSPDLGDDQWKGKEGRRTWKGKELKGEKKKEGGRESGGGAGGLYSTG